MTDFVFLRGGPCIPECLPICEGCRESTWNRHAHPLPTKVAGEYNRDHFVLGWTLNPLSITYERRAFECTPVVAGDFVAMYAVPELHTIHDVYLAIEPEQTTYHTSDMPGRMHYPNNMVGLQVSLTFQLRDSEGVIDAAATLPAVPATLNDVASPPKPAVGQPQVNLYRRAAVSAADGGFFVPKDRTLIVGLTIDTLPTVNPYGSGAFPMEMMSGAIKLASRLNGYEVPING